MIAGIERGVERAERVFAVPNQNREAERRIRKAIEHAGVQVWRAPKGVKRARENRTGLDGRFVHILSLSLAAWMEWLLFLADVLIFHG